MCGKLFGNGAGVTTDTALQQQQANQAGELNDDYVARFLPLEREMLNYARSDDQIKKEASEAKETAGKIFDAGAGTTKRQLAGFGAALNTDQKQTLSRMRSIDKSGSKILAANNVREAADNRQEEIKSNLINIGRGAQAQGMSGLGAAANQENVRNEQAYQKASQKSSSRYGMLGTAIGIGARFAI